MNLDRKFRLKKILNDSAIKKRVKELSKEITSYFPEDEDLVVICVLNGSIIFCSDLIKNMKENVILDTIRVKSYSKSSRGKIRVINDTTINIQGKKVLIVEDIVDTGQTINFLYNYIKDKKPAEIKIVSFLFKPDVYKLNVNIDWVGFNIDNDFVIGYGLDYDEKFRNLDSVYKLIYEKE